MKLKGYTSTGIYRPPRHDVSRRTRTRHVYRERKESGCKGISKRIRITENKERNNVMKKKKTSYIAPDIIMVEMERENIMDHPSSYIIRDRNGDIIDRGDIIEGMPDDAKETSPFSGEWEL